MGATNCPETPRQKMITMMYLVYTALLALNVSAEVINGFKSVGNSMQQTNKNLTTKLEDTWANFDAALKNSPEKVQDHYNKAQQVQKLSQELRNFIDSIEYEYIGGTVASSAPISKDRNIVLRDANGKAIIDSVRAAMDAGGFSWFNDKQLEDNNTPTKFFIGSAENPVGPAIELKNKILEYKHKVNQLLGEDSTHVKLGLNVEQKYVNKEGDSVEWELYNFSEVVAGAALVSLTQLKSETMNAEFDAVNRLYRQVSQGDFSFDQVAMISRPRSTYIIQGGTYETKINVAAYDSKQSFTAVVNGQTLQSGDSGTAVYRTQCNSLGPQRITGVARVSSPDGGVKEYPINDVYFVAKPAGALQLDGLQVVYAGVENPMTASAAGIDSRTLSLSVEGGKATIRNAPEGDGHYIMIPDPSSKTIYVNINATIDKKVQQLLHQKLLVKEIPEPILRIGAYENGATMPRKDFSAGTVVLPIKNPNFLLKIDNKLMKITKVKVAVGAREASNQGGPRLTEEQANLVKRSNKGEKVYITAEVLMPDQKMKKVYFTATLK